jgi:methyltransferase (TIGR00027 family)
MNSRSNNGLLEAGQPYHLLMALSGTHDTSARMRDMRDIVAATIFRVIQVVLSPFAAVGYLIFVVRSFMVSRGSGVSETALASLYTRWMQHQLGTRLDEPCERLMAVLPNVPPLGLRLTTGPTLLAHRMTGYVPAIYRYPYQHDVDPPMAHEPVARTTFLDVALDRHLGHIDQLVILGAGHDTRAYRLHAGTRVRCFEVDTPRTQRFKREMLEKAGVDAARVTFVPADLMQADWLEKLMAAGFEPGKQSLFIWEGVTMYLDRAAVENILHTVAGTAVGSVVAFDYLTTDTMESRSLYMRYARAALKVVGEPWRFGIDGTPPMSRQVAAFLESCGLTMGEHRNVGRESGRKHAAGGLVTATAQAPYRL